MTRRTAGFLALVVTVLVVIGLALTTAGRTRRGEAAHPSQRAVTTSEYLPGLAADVALPSATHQAPVVVLVPGGGWHTADRTGLVPLSRALADGGAVAVDITYRASDQGGRLPDTVAEIGCAAGFAVTRARAAGIEPTHVVLLGHSAGGHLAALAALEPTHFRGAACPYPPVRVDGMVGLAGAYEPQVFGELADPFFGGPRDVVPAAWRDGDPEAWAARPEHPLRVLLLHGDADQDVPPAMTSRFAVALRTGGNAVTVATLAGADHADAYAADRVGAPVVAWLRAWPAVR